MHVQLTFFVSLASDSALAALPEVESFNQSTFVRHSRHNTTGSHKESNQKKMKLIGSGVISSVFCCFGIWLLCYMRLYQFELFLKKPTGHSPAPHKHVYHCSPRCSTSSTACHGRAAQALPAASQGHPGRQQADTFCVCQNLRFIRRFLVHFFVAKYGEVVEECSAAER
jgi:hypothetical protein